MENFQAEEQCFFFAFVMWHGWWWSSHKIFNLNDDDITKRFENFVKIVEN
jgi:hypothetical protein